jgi:serine/threonine protein phosphatase PrpC
MSFFVTRAAAASRPEGSHDRADVFARGDTAVLVVADGAGGLAGAAAASDVFVDRVRDVVLDATFDLLAPSGWERLFRDVDVDLALRSAGETTAVVVVLAIGMLVCTVAGDSEAWLMRPTEVDPLDSLTAGASRARLGSGRARPSSALRGRLEGRLVVATDGLFRHVAKDHLLAILRQSRFGSVADALVDAARSPSGDLADDIAVLVAEP